MNTNEIKTVVDAAKELNESYIELLQSLKGTTKEAKAAKQLWKKERRPLLVKIGLALILFPEPVVSDIIGSLLVAAGTVQEGIHRRTVYLEDVPKTFRSLLNDLCRTQRKI